MNLIIVGGGISGLSAAYTLQDSGHKVMLLEGSDRLGGKILTTEIAGSFIDAGPDSFLTRDPEMRDLCASLGLGDELVSPSAKSAKIWVNGVMHDLPKRHYLGVPLDLNELEGLTIISSNGVSDARSDLDFPDNSPSGDESIGSLIRRRLGDEVMDNLVGPLLGGINAGNANELSLEAGVPNLFHASRFHPSLILSIKEFLAAQNNDPSEPIFLTHPDGLQRVVDALENQLFIDVRFNEKVREVRKVDGSWFVDGGQTYRTDAVLLCLPAFAASNIISDVAPKTSRLMSEIEYASMAFITLAFPSTDVPDFDGSGFLVGRDEGMLMTACSWTSAKWKHCDDGEKVFIRLSVGHFDDDRGLQLSDDDLVKQLLAELETTTGINIEPLAVRVTRWPNSFPQYGVGHKERVNGILKELQTEAPGLFLAGAAFNGLGLSACVRDGTLKARTAIRYLEENFS